jgi:hypothetical protein
VWACVSEGRKENKADLPQKSTKGTRSKRCKVVNTGSFNSFFLSSFYALFVLFCG